MLSADLWLMPYEDSVAPDQPVHPRSLIWEPHCLLIMMSQQISRQSGSQIGLCDCWSESSMSAYGILPSRIVDKLTLTFNQTDNAAIDENAWMNSLIWKLHCLHIGTSMTLFYKTADIRATQSAHFWRLTYETCLALNQTINNQISFYFFNPSMAS